MKIKQLIVRSDCKDSYLNYNFRNARLNAGHTYHSLAEELGVSFAVLADYERLRAFPSEDGAKKIAKLLNVPVEKFFSSKIQEITREVAREKRDGNCQFIPLSRQIKRNLESKNSQDYTSDEELYSVLLKALNTLPERSRYVLERRFGLNGFEPATLEDVGKELRITGERVRMIETNALEYLKHPVRSRSLEAFLE